ncbi:MAG: amidohydrolase family protein [Phycisphaerales bacterium]|nr:amidohydrolase family protein [Phycisphaerales bacterium]
MSWHRQASSAICAVLILASYGGAAERFAIRVGGVVMPDGTVTGPSLVTVVDGRISEVRAGAEAAASGGKVVDHPSAVLAPGMVDVLSGLGVIRRGSHVERVRAIDPDLSIREAIEQKHDDFRAALKSGVTAALVIPAGNNVIGGAAQAVRLTGGGGVEWLREPGPLMFCVGQGVLEATREPTGMIGAVHLLREALTAAKDSKGSSRVNAFLKSSLDGLLTCDEEQEVIAAARVFTEGGRLPLLAWTPLEASAAMELVKPFPDPLIIGPFTLDTPARVLRGAGALQQAGRELAFAGALPVLPGSSARISAALAVRYGMDAAAARRALTINAAKAAGVAERVGAIQPGKDADMVIYSADPLRLDARVLEVYVKGVKVHDASLE